MPQIETVDLPPAKADGSRQFFRIHRVPTHGQAKRISAAFVDAMGGSDILGIETIVVRTLVTEALVKDDEGREIAWNGEGEDAQGAGIEDVPEELVSAMYAEATKVVDALFPKPAQADEKAAPGNRAGRRQQSR